MTYTLNDMILSLLCGIMAGSIITTLIASFFDR